VKIKFDNSWQALHNPGGDKLFFAIPNLTNLQINTNYNNINAYLLMEFAHLIYRDAKHKNQASRNDILAKINWEEVFYLDIGITQAAIFQPKDRSAAVVAFRGTDGIYDWLGNFKLNKTIWKKGGLVHAGFKYGLDLVWQKISIYLDELDKLNTPIFYAGHSLGGALTTLAASKKTPYVAYAFGTPRVGNYDFTKTLKNTKLYRIVNHQDLVTRVPFKFLNFQHVGETHYISHDNKMLVNPSDNKIRLELKSKPLPLSNKNDHKTLGSLNDHTAMNYLAHLQYFI
jgi:hypothetical protein